MIVFHIDVNNAFLSWEAIHRFTAEGESLDLRTVPSVIGGSEENRHGIVLAKSPPAKAYGIRTAETLMEARNKCPNLLVVPPRHDLYRNYSQELIRFLKTISPVIEPFSIDEAFIDMTETALLSEKEPAEAAHWLREEIFQRFGYTVNIGVSSVKILAKMASDFEKPNRVHTLFPHEIQKKMWPLPVRDLFGVGAASAKKLYTLGIRTIGELANFDRDILIAHMGKHGAAIHGYANGIDPSAVISRQPDNKGYGNSTTLPADVTDSTEAKRILRGLCQKVSSRLKADDYLAQVTAVSIRNNLFQNSSHQCTLPATNDPENLYQHICQLFDELWDGSPIRLLGVSTSKLTKEAPRQISLLDSDFYKRQGKMDEAVEKIRKKFGDNAIFRGSSLK